MFTERYNSGDVKSFLFKKWEFKPFAAASEREQWESVPAVLKADLIAKGEKFLSYQWPLLPATRYMDFMRDGNRNRFEKIYFERRLALGSLTVAECMEGKGRFIDDIINGVWCICEESAWNIHAHNDGMILPDVKKPIIDLFAAETGALMSWVHYLLKQQLNTVSPFVSERIAMEVKRRILDPYINRDDFWWRHHVSNWNPWCNSNCLTVFLLMEEDEIRRVQAVMKCMESLDVFIASYHDDGGCDEGPVYWNRAGGSLYDCLELLYVATGGKINLFAEEKNKNIGRFIYRAHISDKFYVNFADASAIIGLHSNHVFMYGSRIGDAKLACQGSANYSLISKELPYDSWYSMNRVLWHIRNYKLLEENHSKFPYVKDVWLDGIQVIAVREQEGSDQGLYFAAKGGHNDESHNHNDVGQFIVYSDGKPAIIDVGVETYTAKTFSLRRYEIWTMQSAYHNLPTVNGIQQQPGKNFKATEVAYACDDSKVDFSLDISPAYPPEAGIQNWLRGITFHRDGKSCIDIVDEFSLTKESEVVFSIMTACKPKSTLPGVILLQVEGGRSIQIEYDSKNLEYISERISIEDARLKPVWGDCVFRIQLKLVNLTKKAKHTMRIYQIG